LTLVQRLETQLEKFRAGVPMDTDELQRVAADIPTQIPTLPDEEKLVLQDALRRIEAAIEFQMQHVNEQLSSTREWSNALAGYAAIRSYKTGQNLNKRV